MIQGVDQPTLCTWRGGGGVIASIAVYMLHRVCKQQFLMCAPDFHFELCNLVVTWLPCVSLIHIFFFLLQPWPDGRPTAEFVVPRCSVSFKDHRSNMK